MLAPPKSSTSGGNKGKNAGSLPSIRPRVSAAKPALKDKPAEKAERIPCPRCMKSQGLPLVTSKSPTLQKKTTARSGRASDAPLASQLVDPSAPSAIENKPVDGPEHIPAVGPADIEQGVGAAEIRGRQLTSTGASTEEEAAELLRVAQQAAAAAAAALKKERGNGVVRLVYEMYSEEFPIVDGSTTQAAIDDVYALSFVMPDCRVHLSTLDPIDKRKADIAGVLDIYVKEAPQGAYLGLEKDTTYYVYVEQDAARLEQDQAAARRAAAARQEVAQQQAAARLDRHDGRAMESCSCIYGSPCLDEYGCRDWSHRFAISSANGWKGF